MPTVELRTDWFQVDLQGEESRINQKVKVNVTREQLCEASLQLLICVDSGGGQEECVVSRIHHLVVVRSEFMNDFVSLF